MKTLLVILAAMLLASCASDAIYIGDTELSERDLRRLLAQLPDTIKLESAYESNYLLKESAAVYENRVVITPGKVGIAGSIFANKGPIILDITREESFTVGESKEPGTDYFVYVLPAPIGKTFQAIISKNNPDWCGYFSMGTGGKPLGYSVRTWKLLGYFHVGPQGRILRKSVVTNGNLDNPPSGVPLPGMVRVGKFAIDIYENSEMNGYCISAYGRTPLTGLTTDEALAMANLSGKRLPTSKQWLSACDPEAFPQILTTKPAEGNGLQNTWSGKVARTGEYASNNTEDFASSGCVDIIGNVWEWCEEVIDTVSSTTMPTTKEGYVSEVTEFNGISYWPSLTSIRRPVESLGYFFFSPGGDTRQVGVARGACCDDGDKAGPGSLFLSVGRKQAHPKVGFRCVR